MINSCLASVDFCHLLIALANSLDPDQDRKMRSCSGSKLFDTLLKNCFEKVNFEKSQEKTT